MPWWYEPFREAVDAAQRLNCDVFTLLDRLDVRANPAHLAEYSLILGTLEREMAGYKPDAAWQGLFGGRR